MIRMGCGCGMKFSGGARKLRKTRRLRSVKKAQKGKKTSAKKTQKK
jgi:hypothetical protein